VDEGGRVNLGKLFTFMTMSLDGFFEGRDHDISWHNVSRNDISTRSENFQLLCFRLFSLVEK